MYARVAAATYLMTTTCFVFPVCMNCPIQILLLMPVILLKNIFGDGFLIIDRSLPQKNLSHAARPERTVDVTLRNPRHYWKSSSQKFRRRKID